MASGNLTQDTYGSQSLIADALQTINFGGYRNINNSTNMQEVIWDTAMFDWHLDNVFGFFPNTSKYYDFNFYNSTDALMKIINSDPNTLLRSTRSIVVSKEQILSFSAKLVTSFFASTVNTLLSSAIPGITTNLDGSYTVWRFAKSTHFMCFPEVF